MTSYKDIILNFLDIETTGLSYSADKIIEIYINKVQNGQTIKTFNTLINPGFRPNPYITKLTNISYSELKNSPAFEDIAEDLYEFLKDGIAVAHNARFDYSFIKNELKNYGLDINLNYCCTVKLSRNLYPHYRSHNLNNIIERTNFKAGNRHRASYDTEVIKSFFYKALDEHGHDKFEKAFNKSIKEAAIPNSLLSRDFQEFPESPGVYIFYGQDNYPIYIGMSKHLRQRIYEHLYNDLTNSKDLSIKQNVKRIEVIPTAGVLGALLRESALVKKYQPLYNHKLRRNKGLLKLEQFVDKNGYLNAKINSDNVFDNDNLSNIIGVFQGKLDLEAKLNDICKNFGLCPKLLGLEKGTGACFSYQLQKCKGACVQKVSADEYNQTFNQSFKNLKLLNWPFESEISIIEKSENLTEELVIDNWCLIKSNLTDEGLTAIEYTSFDLDTYKILLSYLKKNNYL